MLVRSRHRSARQKERGIYNIMYVYSQFLRIIYQHNIPLSQHVDMTYTSVLRIESGWFIRAEGHEGAEEVRGEACYRHASIHEP